MSRRARRRGSFHKFFGRRIWRRGRFRFHFLPRFLGCLVIGNRFPAEIDDGCRNRSFHGGGALARDGRGDHRRGDYDGFTANNRARRFGCNINIHVSLEPISLHWFATLRADLIITRSLIHNGRVVVSDVGDVGRLINDRHVAFRR